MLGQVAHVLDLAPGEAGIAQAPAGRRRAAPAAAAWCRRTARARAVDRRRGLHRELLADDAAQQHPVGVDRRAPRRAASATESSPSRVDQLAPSPDRMPPARGCALSRSIHATAILTARERHRPRLAGGTRVTRRSNRDGPVPVGRCRRAVPAQAPIDPIGQRPRLTAAAPPLLALAARGRRRARQRAAQRRARRGAGRRRSRTSSSCSPTTRRRARCG